MSSLRFFVYTQITTPSPNQKTLVGQLAKRKCSHTRKRKDRQKTDLLRKLAQGGGNARGEVDRHFVRVLRAVLLDDAVGSLHGIRCDMAVGRLRVQQWLNGSHDQCMK